MNKLWPFKDERAKLSGNFAAETPFGRVFRSWETTLWHTSAILHHSSPHFEAAKWLRNGLQKYFTAEKSPLSCEITFRLRNDLQALKWLRNHLQASK